MRIRTIKPEFFKHDELAILPPLARILFVGLWCMADCKGRLEDRPQRIKAEVLPYDEIDMNLALNALADGKFIIRYVSDDIKLIQVVAFEAHQRITGKEAESQSKYPAPEPLKKKRKGETLGNQQGNTWETPETTGREGKGREGKGSLPVSPKPGEEQTLPTTKPPTPPESEVPPLPPPPPLAEEPKADPRHRDFIDLWCKAFEKYFVEKYVFSGRDASALKRLLKTCKDPAEELVSVAIRAWERSRNDRYVRHCKSAATIHEFADHLNQIRVELHTPAAMNGSGQTLLLDAETVNRTRS